MSEIQGYHEAAETGPKFYSVAVAYVVVQFYFWFNFYFLLFLGMVMCDNECKTKENKNYTKDKIEPQHIQLISLETRF